MTLQGPPGPSPNPPEAPPGGPGRAPGAPARPARGTPCLGSAARDDPLKSSSMTLQGPPGPSPDPPEAPPAWAPQPGMTP
ncbi:hypothetical protein Q8A73_023969 [Channa argus]|nr:hypothetical protein Q8A73_023969 [Channa argus]